MREFVSMMRNPGGYHKIHGLNSWDFDTMMDYVYSFWIVKKICSQHPAAFALAYEGVTYTCTCPQFLHYHVCKHVVGAGLFYDPNFKVPTVFSKVTVGKRAAPAGAKLLTRGHCLEIDN